MPKIYYGVVALDTGNTPFQLCPDCLSENASDLFPGILSLTGPVEGPKCDFCKPEKETAAEAQGGAQ